MRIKWYYEDEIKDNFEFDDEKGVFYIRTDSMLIQVNSWNFKVKVYLDGNKIDDNDLKILKKVLNYTEDDEDEKQ